MPTRIRQLDCVAVLDVGSSLGPVVTGSRGLIVHLSRGPDLRTENIDGDLSYLILTLKFPPIAFAPMTPNRWSSALSLL